MTTAWPSAASVGARITARSSASAHKSSGNTTRASDESGHERQRQADPEQAQRHRELAAQRAHVDPRGVREQDQRKRRLGEQLDRLSGRRRLDEPQRLRADEQSDGGEDHRGGDRRTRDPAGDRREREQSQRDDGERPVHGRTLCHRLAARTLGGARRPNRTESRR